MMNLIKSGKLIAWMGIFTLLLCACDKTDKYYETLELQPELMKNYDPLYTVGDLMIIEGRFNESDLSIQIGDAAAKIEKIERKSYQVDYGYQDSIQSLSIRITENMGIGVRRPVYIKSSGIKIEGPAIEIIEDAQSGVLKGKLAVVKIADYPVGSDPVYCRSGKGSLYFIDKDNYVIRRMDTQGAMTQVFEPSSLKDNDGQSFTFTRLNGAGIDPNERFLYLSLYSQATGSQENHYYRLVRYDLQARNAVVLNKTAYSRISGKRTLQSIQPFDGDIAQVKLFAITGIYPDRNGNIYFEMDQRFITRLSKEGKHSYLLKNGRTMDRNPVDPAPQVIDPSTGSYYSAIRVSQLFPGVIRTDASLTKIMTFNPDDQEYWFDDWYLNYSVNRMDLKNQVSLNTFSGTGVLTPTIYISGSFNVLSGSQKKALKDNSMWGYMPIGKGKLLVLYYQEFNSRSDFPAWGVLDFEQERGYRYAPGKFDNKGYQMSPDDLLLNYDEEGMLLMTANNKKAILKTIYQ